MTSYHTTYPATTSSNRPRIPERANSDAPSNIHFPEMIEQDYVDVDPESSDEMDSMQSVSTRSDSSRSKAADGEAPPCTTKQNNDLIISTMEMLTRSDTELSKALKATIYSLEQVKKDVIPRRCSGPANDFKDLRSNIIDMYVLAKDAENNTRCNLQLLAERLSNAQLIRQETLPGLALKDNIRAFRDNLSKLTKTATTDNNSVPPSLKNDSRDAVLEGSVSNNRSVQKLKLLLSALKGQCSEDEDENHATLDFLADELDTFRYELAMLRRDITSVRVPGALEDISISKDVDALYMSVSALEQEYGKNTHGRYDPIAATLTDIPTLRNQIRILRAAASTIHDLLLRNEKNMHQRASELYTNLMLKSKIRSTQAHLKMLRDRINYAPSPPLHHMFLENDAAMAEREDSELKMEIAWRCKMGDPENDAYTGWLLGPSADQESLKAKILYLCKKDPAFKDKVAACVSEEKQGLPAASQDGVDLAKDNENLSGAGNGILGPFQAPSYIQAPSFIQASSYNHAPSFIEALEPMQFAADSEGAGEKQGLPAATQDEVDPAKDNETLSGAGSEALGPIQSPSYIDGRFIQAPSYNNGGLFQVPPYLFF